jgi:hypothetical protein
MCAMRPSPNGFWLPVCIAKAIGSSDPRVTSMPRLAFEGLELSDGKLSRSVVCPAKAGMFSGSQSREGNNQKPCSLDGRYEGDRLSEAHRQSNP